MNTFSAIVPFVYYNPITFTNILPLLFFSGGTLCASMASQALNQLSEKKYDAIMKRTNERILPSGRYSDARIKILASQLLVLSFSLYYPLKFFNLYALPTIAFSYVILGLYNIQYTKFKRISNWGMHIGALVGAIVPLLGSIASKGLLYDEFAFILGLFIFAWQYPHFYGINYRHRQCYARAGFEFISKHPSHDNRAMYQIFIASVIMLMCAIKLYSQEKINLLHFSIICASLVPVFKNTHNLTRTPKKLLISSYPFYLVFTLGLVFFAKN